MFKLQLFRKTFILLVLIGIINFTATYLYLYWTSNWFDKSVHFLAGIAVSMATTLFVLFFYKKIIQNFPLLLKTAIASTIFVGLVWEVYELYFEIEYFNTSEYVFDTSLDLVMDTLGGLVGVYYAHKLLLKDKIINE